MTIEEYIKSGKKIKLQLYFKILLLNYCFLLKIRKWPVSWNYEEIHLSKYH